MTIKMRRDERRLHAIICRCVFTADASDDNDDDKRCPVMRDDCSTQTNTVSAGRQHIFHTICVNISYRDSEEQMLIMLINKK